MRIEGHLLRERLPENLEADREEEEDDEEEDVCLSSEIYLFICLLLGFFSSQSQHTLLILIS